MQWGITVWSRTYSHMMLPLDFLWQGLICREQATAFHISGRHFLMSSTGMFMKGILMVPLDHSLMSFMAPWSDWTLQLLNSSVGLHTDRSYSGETHLFNKLCWQLEPPSSLHFNTGSLSSDNVRFVFLSAAPGSVFDLWLVGLVSSESANGWLNGEVSSQKSWVWFIISFSTDSWLFCLQCVWV